MLGATLLTPGGGNPPLLRSKNPEGERGGEGGAGGGKGGNQVRQLTIRPSSTGSNYSLPKRANKQSG